MANWTAFIDLGLHFGLNLIQLRAVGDLLREDHVASTP